MQHLSKKIILRLRNHLRTARSVFILLDYDGTLTPIVENPSKAKLNFSSKKILEKLSHIPQFKLGIVTGRSLKNIKSLIGIKNIIYVGNHGLELQGDGFKNIHVKAKNFTTIRKKIIKTLKPLLRIYPGTLIENKNVGLSFHYRMLSAQKVRIMRNEVMIKILPFLANMQIELSESKKAFNIRPRVQWNKGSAVQWLLLTLNPDSEVIFIGDDTNDESAFKVLIDRGNGIRVGYSKHSSARYYVRNIREVGKFLEILAG